MKNSTWKKMTRPKDKRIFDLPQSIHIGHVYDLWRSGNLCDVTISAGGREFYAHRLILAASSQYFKAMFSSGMEECKSGKVDLPDVTSLSMDLILNAIYRQDLELNPDVIDDVLSVSHRLEFSEILYCCEKYITEELISPANCLYYLGLGEKFDLKTITESAQNCLLSNFSQVCIQEKFLELSKEILQEYIESEQLNCESELEVFWAIIRWLKHKFNRKDLGVELLRNVRYGLMLPRELLNEVWNEPTVARNEECQDLIKNAIEYHSNPNMKPIISERWCRPRYTENHLVILSGRFQDDDVYGSYGCEGYHFPPSRMLFIFPFTEKEKATMVRLSKEMSPFSSTYNSSGVGVQIGHYLFIFGGYHKYADEFSSSLSASNTCWKFNSVDGTIDQINNMDQARVNHIAVQIDKDKIMVAGGANDMTEYSGSSSIYNIGKNSWETGSRLPRRLVFMAACEHKTTVYISGGKSDESNMALKSLYTYDRYQKRWVTESDMYKRRMQHVMCSVNDRIYVFGGAEYDEDIECVEECEYFDPETSQWTAFTTRESYSFSPRVFASCFVYNSLVYILGGSHAGRYYDRSTVYCFDPETHGTEKSHLPYGISRSIMAVMQFPKSKNAKQWEAFTTGKKDSLSSPSPRERERWRSRSRTYSRSPNFGFDYGYDRSPSISDRSASPMPVGSPSQSSHVASSDED